jgi:hypothetical protein
MAARAIAALLLAVRDGWMNKPKLWGSSAFDLALVGFRGDEKPSGW